MAPMHERTLPRQQASDVTVDTLAVEVVEGPDAGPTRRASGDRVSIGSAEGNDLVLRDPTVSRYHLDVVREPRGFLLIDHGSTNGTRVGTVLVQRALVPPGTRVAVGSSTLLLGEGTPRKVELHPDESLGAMRGRSPALRRLMAQALRVAATGAPVLVIGESGTGKELLARALHEEGPRRAAPFETVDCGALVPALVASELFGHERGAFTSADRQHAGAFERAGDGTVFLDEIGELPAAVQAALLGALERKRFRRVGGKVDLPLGARVVSATHRDLRAEVNEGRFRLDLYYRLAVVTLRMPALRERPEDIPLLVEHFAREAGHAGAIEELVSPAAMQALAKHAWPGNVRELRNVVEATMALGEVPALEVERGRAAGEEAPGDVIGEVLDRPYKRARDAVLHAFEARYLARLLEQSGGNVSRAARDGQMDRSHLIEMLRRHGLSGR
jgi:DNA-binding NtrC family response regulator